MISFQSTAEHIKVRDHVAQVAMMETFVGWVVGSQTPPTFWCERLFHSDYIMFEPGRESLQLSCNRCTVKSQFKSAIGHKKYILKLQSISLLILNQTKGLAELGCDIALQQPGKKGWSFQKCAFLIETISLVSKVKTYEWEPRNAHRCPK